MRKLCGSVGALCIVALLANHALGLEIRVAPKTLVLSSSGGKVTVHTDVPFEMADTVSLDIAGSAVAVSTFADDLGNLVAQCTKQAVKDVIGDFEGKTTTVTLTLEVNGVSASEDIRVKK